MSIISPIYPKPKAFKMPVVTRSRSQCNSVTSNATNSVVNNVVNNVIKVESEDSHSQLGNKASRFISVCNKYLAESEALRKKKENSLLLGNTSEAEVQHFDNVRIVTELIYIINQHFPDICTEDTSRFPNARRAIYDRIREVYGHITNNEIIPKTREELSSTKSLIEEFQVAEKMLMPNRRPIRGAYVDYAGMDCIDDENNKIPTFWIDLLAIATDPDYDPENIEDQQQILEDEQDDENFDKYVVYDEEDEQDEDEQDTDEDEDLDEDDEEDEEEDDDLEDEDDEEEEDDLEDEEDDDDDEIIEITVVPRNRNNHIRFIYDDDDEE